jgi:hypothetical protein
MAFVESTESCFKNFNFLSIIVRLEIRNDRRPDAGSGMKLSLIRNTAFERPKKTTDYATDITSMERLVSQLFYKIKRKITTKVKCTTANNFFKMF